jgi:hypothetical protein
MKLVINAGVRQELQEMAVLAQALEANQRIGCNPAYSHSVAINASAEAIRLESRLANLALRMVSHATRGKMYPLMTQGVYGPREMF